MCKVQGALSGRWMFPFVITTISAATSVTVAARWVSSGVLCHVPVTAASVVPDCSGRKRKNPLWGLLKIPILGPPYQRHSLDNRDAASEICILNNPPHTHPGVQW